MFDNNMNNNYNNNRPLFNNYNNFSSLDKGETKDYFENDNSNDLPPILEEIKNLNDSSVYEAPTLDALGPANFILENNNNFVNDPLSLYENGNVDLSNHPDNLSSSNSYNSLNSINNSQDNNYDYDFNTISNYESDTNNYNLNNENNTLNNIKNNVENNIFPEENKVDSFNYDMITSKDGNYIINNEQSTNLKDDINNLDFNIETKDYEINNDILISKEKDNLSDLQIMDSYDEPDMLEIMDIDNEDVNEKLMDNRKKLEDNIDKIKKLVEEIKLSGIDISLEEFDFESMYQIIIKFNKE